MLLAAGQTLFAAIVAFPCLLPSRLPLSLYHVHPLLATAALIVATDATLPSRRNSPIQHRTQHLRALIVLSISILAILYSRHRRNKPHFSTLHSTSSLIILALMLFQAIHGTLIHAYPNIQCLRRIHRIRGLPLHRVIGWICLALSWWSAGLAAVKESRPMLGDRLAFYIVWSAIGAIFAGTYHEIAWRHLRVIAPFTPPIPTTKIILRSIVRKDSGVSFFTPSSSITSFARQR